jgi:hypothetical protein
MQTTKAIQAMAMSLVLLAGAARAAPDFSGAWALNPSKGQNLGMVAAIQETITIAQTAERLAIDYASTFQGETTKRKVSYDLAGKPVMNPAAMGGESETVAKWAGDKLVVTWTSEGAIAGTKVTRTETWALAADGQSLSVESVRGTSAPRVLVYEKKK